MDEGGGREEEREGGREGRREGGKEGGKVVIKRIDRYGQR